MENEELNLQIPVLKNTLNFPNETNYILRNYSLFEIKKISQSEIGVACDIIQNHLLNTFYFLLNRQRIDSVIIKKSIIYFEEEIKFIFNITALIKNLEIHQQDEIGNHIKKKAQIEREIDTFKLMMNKGEIEMSSNEETKELNRKIENIAKEINETILLINQNDLIKAFTNLSTRKDVFEITIFTSIVNLLEGVSHVEPKTIKKLMEDYPKFISRISQFDPRNIDKNFALGIKENISRILIEIDPKLSNNHEKVKQYSYLLNFSKWVELAINLAICVYELELTNSNFTFGERKSKNDSKIFSSLLIQNEEHKLSPVVQNEKNKINQILDELKSLEEVIQKNITIDYDILKFNENSFFRGFNYFLLPEENMINDLYLQFNKEYSNNFEINYKSLINEPSSLVGMKNKEHQSCFLKFCNWYCFKHK